MAEEAKKEEKPKEEVKSEIPEQTPEFPQRITMEDAIAERKKLDDAVLKLKSENDRYEKIANQLILDGKGFAGFKGQKAVETDKEYARKIMRGEI